MPVQIEGKTYYTPEEVRSDYMPKTAFDQRTQKLGAKLEAAEAQVIELTTRVREADPLRERVANLTAELTATRDKSALERAGISDPKDVEFLRMVHAHSLKSAESPPEDPAEHFRQWLIAEDGARAGRHTAHMFSATQPDSEQAQPPPDPAPAPPPPGLEGVDPSVVAAVVAHLQGAKPPTGTPNTAAGASTPSRKMVWTPDKVANRVKEIEASGAEPAEIRKQLAALESEVVAGSTATR